MWTKTKRRATWQHHTENCEVHRQRASLQPHHPAFNCPLPSEPDRSTNQPANKPANQLSLQLSPTRRHCHERPKPVPYTAAPVNPTPAESNPTQPASPYSILTLDHTCFEAPPLSFPSPRSPCSFSPEHILTHIRRILWKDEHTYMHTHTHSPPTPTPTPACIGVFCKKERNHTEV